MKSNKLISRTNHSRTYKMLRRKVVADKNRSCSFCPPHRGCNKWYGSNWNRNWKEYRKTQYKIINYV